MHFCIHLCIFYGNIYTQMVDSVGMSEHGIILTKMTKQTAANIETKLCHLMGIEKHDSEKYTTSLVHDTIMSISLQVNKVWCEVTVGGVESGLLDVGL